ncbi:MAG: hypothetical protein NC417_05980 [Candidatus Gastranaerophilales bacterium]|nr:hypothetical protein [Candidatus Gastranaerophilales bacterium]
MEQNRIFVKTGGQGKPIGDLFGIFFEDINHAADGGLYAEMVRNRSFEFAEVDHPSYHALTGWEKIGTDEKVTLSVREGDAVSPRNPHYLHMEAACEGSGVGVRNVGFGGGMYIEKGKRYCFSCYARAVRGEKCVLQISLQGGDGECLAKAFVTAGKAWERSALVLEAAQDTVRGSLAITIAEGWGVELDLVSLFPEETYLGRKNGLRKDLAEAIAELGPKFMRFPGGCLVHDGSLDADARDSLYRWKNTIGPLEERPARRNNWRYNQTLGLGYYEYFLFCEDIGAKPVPILPAAYDPHHKRAVPLDELQPWIQEALDLIEFANGDEGTKWGHVRVSLGHRAPFGLEYLGIGNEEVGEGFRERFPYFVKAIKEKYPEIKLIGSSGPFCAGSEYDLGWECARNCGAQIVDEHYYMSPEWFLENLHRYDTFEAREPYVFLGEYASHANRGANALAEAAFMTGLQNASHAVKMACYAPLLCHRDYVNWRPDMIWFDNGKVCKSVNYQVQKLFMNHQGDELLDCVVETAVPKETLRTVEMRKRGAIAFLGDDARVEFTDIHLRNEDTGEVFDFSDREVLADRAPVFLMEEAPADFTLRFHARELEGYKGFRVSFGWKNEKERLSWLLGGWEGQDAAFVEDTEGGDSFLTQNQFALVRGQEYALQLRVKGDRIEGWIDGKLFQWTHLRPVEIEALYLTASRERETSDIILKAVNLRREDFAAEIRLPDLEARVCRCDSYVLREADCVESPDFPDVETVEVKRQERALELDAEKGFSENFPARSVTVMRLKI